MKEAIQTPYNRCVFRETFRDEQSVRRNGGNPINVTFANGELISPSSGSSLLRYSNLSGTSASRSYRLKIYFDGVNVNIRVLIDTRSNSWISGFLVVIKGNTNLPSFSIGAGTIYVNGSTSPATLNVGWNEIVILNISTQHQVCLAGNVASAFPSYGIKYDLFEIYQGTLTASEVANLYNNTWNTEHSPTNILLDFDSTQGTIKDRTGKNTLTPTDVSIKKIGQSYSADFNGTTSKIDTGTDFIGTKAITVCGWIYNTNLIGYQRILDNSKFRLRFHTTNTFQVTSDHAKYVYSLKTVPLNSWQFISLTRKVDGKISLYFGDKSNSPVLDGSADRDSGTPTVADSNVFIGSNPSGMDVAFFYGNIPMLKVYEGILSLEDITQIWSSTRGKFI